MCRLKNKFYKYHINDVKSIDDLSNNDTKYNILIKDNKIEYDSFKKPDNANYLNIYKKYFNNFITKYLIYFITICIFLYAIPVFNNVIVEVEIENNSFSKSLITNELVKIGPVYYLNKDLNDIKEKLKYENPNFMFLEFDKQGTKLIVKENNYKNINYFNNNDYGDLISKYDGYILKYYVEDGKIVVNNNQFVNKGDILITGLVPGYIEDVKVHPRGYVIGEVVVVEELKIKKSYTDNSRTGRIKKVNTFFPSSVKSVFNSFEVEKQRIIRFLPLYKVIIYERNNKKINVTKEEAISYGKIKIDNKYNLIFSNENEKIISIVVKTIKEDSSFFYISYLVKMHINLCEFVKYS